MDGQPLTVVEFAEHACCLYANVYPLFFSGAPVRVLIEKGAAEHRCPSTAEESISLFGLDEERLERPIRACGNECFRSMAAVGYSMGKEVFCFPWFSSVRRDAFGNNIKFAVKFLEEQGKTVILPRQKSGFAG